MGIRCVALRWTDVKFRGLPARQADSPPSWLEPRTKLKRGCLQCHIMRASGYEAVNCLNTAARAESLNCWRHELGAKTVGEGQSDHKYACKQIKLLNAASPTRGGEKKSATSPGRGSNVVRKVLLRSITDVPADMVLRDRNRVRHRL